MRLTNDQCTILVLRGQVTDLEGQVRRMSAEEALRERQRLSAGDRSDLINCVAWRLAQLETEAAELYAIGDAAPELEEKIQRLYRLKEKLR